MNAVKNFLAGKDAVCITIIFKMCYTIDNANNLGAPGLSSFGAVLKNLVQYGQEVL